jgi:hypothetical protein
LSKGVETGTIKLLVDHPDFIPNHSERIVAMTCPRAISWKPWANYFAWRFGREGPIVLRKGAILSVRQRKDFPGPGDVPLYVQVGDWEREDTNVWVHPEPGVVLTRRLPAGSQNIRAVAFDTNGCAWFSDVISVNAVSGQTNDLSVVLKKGSVVHGRLDAIVPRPVVNGRVMASIWLKETSLHWHTWAEVHPDGTFELRSLPQGELEVIAVGDGFVSANGKGDYSGIHYSQHYLLGTNDLAIDVTMEPTATLDVEVRDDHGKPLRNAKVFASASVKYGGGEVTSPLGTDCDHTADFIREGPSRRLRVEPVVLAALTNYYTMTDGRGRALVRNLPVEVSMFDIQHAGYVLPEIDFTFKPRLGSSWPRYNVTPQKLRVAKVALVANATNYTVVRLERR